MPAPHPVKLSPPKAVRDIAATLERAGFETWCVGGAVRDALLGATHLDWDLATAATPEQVQRLFRRTVPVGVSHGTVGVLDREGRLHEITTFRKDVRTDGRHAEVVFGVSLDQDLARRDFTVNAIAYSPRLDVLHDPFGGQEDLRRGVLRAVGAPDERMREDWLRALRALRFAGRFGFEIHPATWQAIEGAAPFLSRLSRERVKQELEKTMDQVPMPGKSMALWRKSGALRALVPALHDQPDIALQAGNFVASPDTAIRSERKSLRRLVRLSTLWFGLEPRVIRSALTDLRFANRDVEAITHLASCWSALAPTLRAALLGDGVVDATLRHAASVTKRPMLAPFLRAAYATWCAERAWGRVAPDGRRSRSAYRRASHLAWRDPVELGDLAIDGDDLLREGFPPGALVGQTLRELLGWVLEDPARNTRAQLLAQAQERRAPEARGGGNR